MPRSRASLRNLQVSLRGASSTRSGLPTSRNGSSLQMSSARRPTLSPKRNQNQNRPPRKSLRRLFLRRLFLGGRFWFWFLFGLSVGRRAEDICKLDPFLLVGNPDRVLDAPRKLTWRFRNEARDLGIERWGAEAIGQRADPRRGAGIGGERH